MSQTTNPFQEKSQNIFNVTTKPARAQYNPSKQAQNGLSTKHNTSTTGRNINNMYATQQEPKKQSKENPILWQAKNNVKSGSQLMGAKMCTSGPNSARGSQCAVDAKIRRAIYATGQNSITRRDVSNDRSVSIDKKIRNKSNKYNQTQQIFQAAKPNVKTQSLVVTQKFQPNAFDLKGAFNATKNRFFVNEKNKFGQNKNHNKSLAHDTSNDHLDQGLNFHHQSVVVYSKKPLKQSASGTILPCRVNGLMGAGRSGIDQGSRNRKNLSQISSASHISGLTGAENGNAIGPQKTKSQVQAIQKLQDTHQSDEESMTETEMNKEEISSGASSDFKRCDNQKKSVAEIFAERKQKYKREQMKTLPLSDQLDYRNPQVLSEFSSDIYQTMKKDEVKNMVDPNYLQKVQTEIKDTSRAFLIEWIIDVHRKFRLTPECLYVAIYIIDQFMSKKKIQKNQLHLLGVSTLFLASKYEEIYPPELRDFLAVSENKFTKQTVLQMEKDILHALNFKLTSPSAYRFLQRFRRMSVALNDDEVFFYAQYLQEIQLLDASLLKFKQSQIAAASIILASKQLKKINCWNKEMEQFSGYTEESLSDVIKEVKSFCMEINPKFISTLKYKFNKAEYGEVAKHQFKF